VQFLLSSHSRPCTLGAVYQGCFCVHGVVAFGFDGDILARAGALKNLRHFAEAAFLGKRERRFTGTIGKVDVGTRVDERFERGGVTLATVSEHNRFD